MTTIAVAEARSPSVEVQSRPRALRRPSDGVALLVPSLIAGLVTFWWFPWNRFLAAGDVTPLLRAGDSYELLDLWNHRVSGAGGTSAPAARAAEVILIRVTGWLGGSEVVAQHLFYALVMAFAAFGAAYLARAFVRDPLAIGAAGLLGSFNVFVLIHLPNPLTMIWLGLVGTCSGMLLRVARGASLSVVTFAAVTLVASYLSLNPPLLATATLTVVAVACAASLLVGPGGPRRAWTFLGRAVPWIIGLNLWWIVPTVLSTVAREGLTVSAVTRVEDWSWSQARNSIPNVLSFTAHWGWVYPQYMPFARSLDAFPWTLLRWALPLLAVATLFLARGPRRVAAWTLIGASALATFLAKGLHWPFEAINLWAYHHVRGLWLLRDPFSKVGGILLLSMVVLAAMTIEAVLGRAANARSPRMTRIGIAALAVATCSALAFPYPLWLGQIGPNGGGGAGLPSAQVSMPAAWHTLAAAVNASTGPGKALVLPLDPYYQVTTTWGYHGADTLASELLKRPVLSLLPGGYLTPAGLVPQMLRSVEQDLLQARGDRAAKLLQLLGVSYVILRRDLAVGQVVRSVADRDVLAAGLALTPGLSRPQDFGVADLYSIAEPAALIWTPTLVSGLVRRDDARTVDALSDLPARGAAVTPGTAPIDELSWEAPDQSSASVNFALRASGPYEVGLAGTNPTRYRLSVIERKEGPELRVSDPVTMSLDRAAVEVAPTQSIPVSNAQVVAVALDGHMVMTDHLPADVDLVKPSTLTAFSASRGSPSRGDRFSSVGECGPRPASSSAPTATRIPQGRRISASAGLACVTFPGPALSPDALYRVRIESRGSADGNVRACLWMNGPGGCAPMPALTTTRGWTTFDAAVHTKRGTTGLTLYLYADASNGKPAIAEYRGVELTPLETVGSGKVAPVQRQQQTQYLRRGAHQVTLAQQITSTPLVASSPLGDCQHSDARTPQQTGLAVEPIDGGVQLRARAHSACVTALIPPKITKGELAISIEVRTVRGRAARMCLWQFGPNHCAEMPALPTSPEWRAYRTEVSLAPGTSVARLYLYADGVSSGTVTEYRKLTVEPAAPEIVNVTPIVLPDAAPTVRREHNGAGAFSADIAGSPYPALVVLDESFGNGWQLHGARVLSHTEVNGYANGWVVASGGALSIRYGPSAWAKAAVAVSAMAALLAIGLAVRRRRKRVAVARAILSGPNSHRAERTELRPSRHAGRWLTPRSAPPTNSGSKVRVQRRAADRARAFLTRRPKRKVRP